MRRRELKPETRKAADTAARREEALQRHKVVSLFSGAMGLDIGLENTGRFEVIACVEKEKAFAESIEANKKAGRIVGQPVVFHRDITQLGPAELMAAVGLEPGELDLLVGGPPCQSFSTAGKRGTVQDHRGTLLWQFLRFVEALRPKFFLMENVRGLLSAALRHRPIAERPEKGGLPLEPDEQPGSVVRAFAGDLQRIEGAKYHRDCFEVNAVNYGAPVQSILRTRSKTRHYTEAASWLRVLPPVGKPSKLRWASDFSLAHCGGSCLERRAKQLPNRCHPE